MNIGEELGHPPDNRTYAPSRSVATKDLVGVEIEMENAVAVGSTYWRATNDGSLRDNGVEYVLSQPLTGVDLLRALDELEHIVHDNGFTPTFGERTSTHVHVDVRDLDKEQLTSYILMYMALEIPLFKLCGEDRESSNFCPSYRQAESQVVAINKLIKANRFPSVHRVLLGSERYAGCNINSVHKFGSLEFRGHRGEYRKEPILLWINLLLSLKDFARNIDPNTIPHLARVNGLDSFVEKVFGRKLFEKVRYSGMYKDVLHGIKLVEYALNLDKLDKAMSKDRSNGVSESFSEFLKSRGIEDDVRVKLKKARVTTRPRTAQEVFFEWTPSIPMPEGEE
jgi:hypothetical protein